MALKFLIPDPQAMAALFGQESYYYLSNWLVTFEVSIVSATSALLVALLFSILSLKYTAFEKIMQPVVALSQSFPLQAITPVILIAMGISFFSKVIISFLIAFFPMYGACATAIKLTPKRLICFSKLYQFSFISECLYIRMPFALPEVLASAKAGFTLAVLGAVIAEFIQQDAGLGRLILSAQSTYSLSSLYICLLMLIAQGLAIYLSLSKLERYIIRKWGFSHV